MPIFFDRHVNEPIVQFDDYTRAVRKFFAIHEKAGGGATGRCRRPSTRIVAGRMDCPDRSAIMRELLAEALTVRAKKAGRLDHLSGTVAVLSLMKMRASKAFGRGVM